MKDLIHLANVFCILSLMAVGGGSAVLPEMVHESVVVNHWVTGREFASIFSLGQMAPGPNLSMVGLVGLKAAGVLGMIVALVAFYLPSSFLAYLASHIWDYFKDNPWRDAIQKGLAPITIGLMLAGVYAVGKSASFNVTKSLDHNLITLGIGAAVCVTLFIWRVNPAVLILTGGVVGWFILRT